MINDTFYLIVFHFKTRKA